MKIAVIHDYADVFRTTSAFARLSQHQVVIYTGTTTDTAGLVDEIGEAEALVLIQQRVVLGRPVMARLPKLRFIAQTGRNVSHLDVQACTDQGIIVSAGGAPSGPYSAVAELAWGLIIASLRHLPFEIERLKQGHWQSTTGSHLYGRNLGVYAFGTIGGPLARVGRAFGMNVVCWGREGSTGRAKAEGFVIANSREEFFETADVISLHLPLNKETRGIVTATDLARMKPEALIVNTSRAPIIAEGALVEALNKGRPGFAAVDVFEAEPVVGASHPLLKMDNVICVPHLGYAVMDTYERICGLAADQILAFAAGKPFDVINPEAMGRK